VLPNQFPGYEITSRSPSTPRCVPKTGLPDFGTLIIHYVPGKQCLELKSLKQYVNAYRNLGIFYENAIKSHLRDLARTCKPKSMVVRANSMSAAE